MVTYKAFVRLTIGELLCGDVGPAKLLLRLVKYVDTIEGYHDRFAV